MILLGLDLGSSSVKASLIDAENGSKLGSTYSPKQEMGMIAQKAGWAEQDPEIWWLNIKRAVREVINQSEITPDLIKAIGISYQMHGLVLIDENKKLIRPSIIWCDSRAVEIGNKAFKEIGEEKCLSSLLNSPGNFTASKLKWIKESEPDTYKRIYKIMLPGDYIAMKLTGKINTTISGLSEGIFWDFINNHISNDILKYFGFDVNFFPEIVPTFSIHGELTSEAAEELDLLPRTKISYRAGDQPNNAFSLFVLNPGEVAATAGTSGVVYGVSSQIKYDLQSRVNTFAHVNHQENLTRLGVLLCINGTGILNTWLKNNIVGKNVNYPEMNAIASETQIGSDGLIFLPFGNGAERVLNNNDIGGQIKNLNFNIHNQSHIVRAAQEGMVFALKYGMEIMENIGIEPSVIRAGKANLFLSPLFRDTLASITNSTIELYNTDGATGAATGAGIGIGFYKSFKEAFENLSILEKIHPDEKNKQAYIDAYSKWKKELSTNNI